MSLGIAAASARRRQGAALPLAVPLVGGVCLLLAVGTCGVAGGAPAAGAPQEIRFAKGTSRATVVGAVAGYEVDDYTLRARAGQSLVAELKSRSTAVNFDVRRPGAGEPMFVGATSGSAFSGTLPADGVYGIRVYLMRNAARRGASARYTLRVAIRPPATR
jgi:hypothetical protein